MKRDILSIGKEMTWILFLVVAESGESVCVNQPIDWIYTHRYRQIGRSEVSWPLRLENSYVRWLKVSGGKWSAMHPLPLPVWGTPRQPYEINSMEDYKRLVAAIEPVLKNVLKDNNYDLFTNLILWVLFRHFGLKNCLKWAAVSNQRHPSSTRHWKYWNIIVIILQCFYQKIWILSHHSVKMPILNNQ